MTAVRCPFNRAILYALLYGAAGPLSLFAAPQPWRKTAGPLGSPYGFRSTPVNPPPSFNRPLPPGLDRDYSLPPGIR